MAKYINRNSILTGFALFIVGASLYYTSTLAQKLADEERKKVLHIARSIQTLSTSSSAQETDFALFTVTENTSIPLIITQENDVIFDSNNVIDSTKTPEHNKALKKQRLAEFKKVNEPIVVDFGTGKSFIYYGESYLLTQLRYFPYVQITIICIFILLVIFALSASYRSLQNQVWVGLSKETAHQLGTPLSSMEGWLEILRSEEPLNDTVQEMQKDLDRLKLVADRFSKVGSEPELEEQNLIDRLQEMVSYMQKRAPNRVVISLQTAEPEVLVNISGPLFDWVIENLIRNALDAMEGKGNINIKVSNFPQQVWIDVQDTGKGIPKHEVARIFAPGFTTKKRGWGLGLSLSRRIVEKYHHGSIFVKQSEVGKGTTFRIIIRR